jgi:hypothetical protein
VSSEPFLKEEKTKQNLMIVISTRGMLLEEFEHWHLAQVLVYFGVTVQQEFGHFAVHGIAEPIVNYIASKPAFWPFQKRAREIGLAHLAMQPLLGAIPHFEIRRQSFYIFDDLLIQVRDAKFETMSHRELICIHEEFVRESGSQLQKLETSKLVRLRHELSEVLPALQYSVTRVRAQQPVLK